MRYWYRARPKPFLDAARRDWQFAAFAWLLRGCGGFARFSDTPLVLPTSAHFPDHGMKGHAGALALFRQVRDHAGMADWPCTVEAQTDDREPPDARSPRDGARIRVIRYAASVAGGEMLVAHFAHELARYLVESLDEKPPGGAPLHEPAVDFASVFLGFGVVMANTTAHSPRWELNECELMHALAMFCHLRNLPAEAAEPHLDAHVRKYLRLAMSDLAQYEGDLRRLRSVCPAQPADSDAGEASPG